MIGPEAFVVAKVGRELFAAPVRLRGVGDGREGGHAFEPIGAVHGERQRAVAAHGMAGDRLTLGVEVEVCENKLRQVVVKIVPHLEVWRPRVLRGVHVEPCALAEVVVVVICDAFAARRGIGKDQRDPVFGGPRLRARFHHCVFMGAG